MKEIENLGIKPTGEIDKRYNRPHTATFSIFECPVCSKQYEIKRSRGLKQKTCKDCRGTQRVTHGDSATRLYKLWQGMKARCENPNQTKYHLYGGKGIKVCEEWQTYEGFKASMPEGYEEGLTIDRLDSSLDYTPLNCRWITQQQNSSETTKRRPVVQLRQVLVPEKHFVIEQEWDSAKQAADSLGLIASHIGAVCLGKRKTHGGFGWEFKD